MGCDIHPWIHHPDFIDTDINGLWRNYVMFKALGLKFRGPEGLEQVTELRGILPSAPLQDDSYYEKFEDEGNDAHSPSWVTAVELHLAISIADEFFKDTTIKGWQHSKSKWSKHRKEWLAIVAYMAGLGIDDAKFVFWFDN